mmetsp:Transcript_76970/g.212707  ORF Transcript_76970/g.212707 Transcript_76970/m.212707 type:complete len:227 (-) Transcript_76970:1892-2572(-)
MKQNMQSSVALLVGDGKEAVNDAEPPFLLRRRLLLGLLLAPCNCWHRWRRLGPHHVPVQQHKLCEVQARRAPDGARHGAQGSVYARRRLGKTTSTKTASSDVREGRHHVFASHLGQPCEQALILQDGQLIFEGAHMLTERPTGGYQCRHPLRDVPEDLEGHLQLARQGPRPSVGGAGERLAREEAVLAVHAPELHRLVVGDRRQRERHFGRGAGNRPCVREAVTAL